MYINSETGNQVSVVDMQNYADQEGLGIEEYASLMGFTLESETNTIEKDTTSADLLDPTTFQKDAAADADVVSQPMTASQAEYVEPENTELAPVDTSLDSQDPDPFIVNDEAVTQKEFQGAASFDNDILAARTKLKEISLSAEEIDAIKVDSNRPPVQIYEGVGPGGTMKETYVYDDFIKEAKKEIATETKVDIYNIPEEDWRERAKSLYVKSKEKSLFNDKKERILEDYEETVYGTNPFSFARIKKLANRLPGTNLAPTEEDIKYIAGRGILTESFEADQKKAQNNYKKTITSISNYETLLNTGSVELNALKKKQADTPGEITQKDVDRANTLIQNQKVAYDLYADEFNKLEEFGGKAETAAGLADITKRTYNNLDVATNRLASAGTRMLAGLGSVAKELSISQIVKRTTGVDIRDEDGRLPVYLRNIAAVDSYDRVFGSKEAEKVVADLYTLTDKINQGTKAKQELGEIKGIEDFGEFMLDLFSEQAVNTAVTVGLGGAGLVAVSAAAGGNKFNEMDMEVANDPTRKISAAQFYASGILFAGAEYLTETVSLGQAKGALNYLGFGKKNFGKAFNIAGEYSAEVISKSANLQKTFKSWGINTAKEGSAEFIAQFSNNLTDIYFLEKNDINWSDGLSEAFITGSLMSGLGFNAPALVGGIANTFRTESEANQYTKRGKEILEIRKAISTIQNNTGVADEASSQEAISALQLQLDGLVEQNVLGIGTAAARVEELSQNDKRQLLDLDTRIQAFKVAVDAINNNVKLSEQQKKGLIASKIVVIDNALKNKNRILAASQNSKAKENQKKIQIQLAAEEGLDFEIVNAKNPEEAIKQANLIIDTAASDGRITPEQKSGLKETLAELQEEADSKTKATDINGQYFGAEFGLPIALSLEENLIENEMGATVLHETGHATVFKSLIEGGGDILGIVSDMEAYISKRFKGAKAKFDAVNQIADRDGTSDIVRAEEKMTAMLEYVSQVELSKDMTFQGKLLNKWNKIAPKGGSKEITSIKTGADVFALINSFARSFDKGELSGLALKVAKGEVKAREKTEKQKAEEVKDEGSKKTFSKSVTDLQTELDNLDQSDFDFDLDQFENAKDNLKFKINAAKKKELAKPKTTEFDTSEKSTIGQINALIPKEIKTNEELRSNERVGLAIKKALAPNGIISNMMIGRRKLSTDELEIALESIGSRWMNYDPAAKRKTDSNVPITFGEWVMSNANFGTLDAKRKVAVAEADKKNKTDLDNKEAQRRTNEESSESTSDTRKTYKLLTSNPKLIPGFVVTEIKNKLTNVISKLTSKLSTRPKGANAQTTPLIGEIKKAIGKVVGDATALPKQIIKRMGSPKDGSYQKFLIDNKKSILENMTTTYLQLAIPAAVEKSVGGAYVLDKNGKRKKDSNNNDIFDPKFVPYPEWVGKEIDREKVSTNKKGGTSGNDIVRRAIQLEVDGKFEDSITDEDFVANFVGSDGKVIRGKRESLGKALAEEAGFEVLTKELQDDRIITQKDLDKDTIGQFEGKQVGDFISDIRQMFESNQKALGEVLADNFVQQVTRDAERGTVKFSKAFRTGIKDIDASINDIVNYLNKENIYNVGGFGMLNELSLKNDDLFKLMKKNRELWQAYVLQGNKSKLTPNQQKKFLNIKNKSGVEYQKWINNSLNYYFNAIDATFGLEPGVAILQNPTAKAAALDTMRKLLKNIISTNKINPIEEFLNITKGWTVSGKSTSIFGNNTGLYNWITSIESVEIQNAVSESGLNLRSSKGSETNKTLYLNNKKALNTIKQETLAKDFISIYKGENKVELTDRDTQSNIAKKDLKTIFDFLQKQYTEKTILPEGVALILKTMNSSMRSPLKTAAKIEGAYLVEGLEAGDYTFEHGIPVTVISTMAAKYITDPKFKWDNIKNAIDKSKVYIIPKKIAKIIDTFYKATFSIDNALDTENPAIYRYQEVNKGLKDALKAAGVVNFDFNNFTYFRDPKKSVKRNIKFSKGIELNLVETGQQAINNARSLAYNNNVKRLDVKAEDISELTTNKAKADWLINKIAEGYNDFYFIDNKMNEVKAVKNVLNTFDVKGKVQQAKVKFSKSMNTTFNEMLQRSTGIEAGETIERSIARRRGATKGKFKVWMPSSLDDFKGLTSYVFAGKGRQGEADQKFFQDALITPYFRGVRAIEQSRQAFKDDFEALNKQMRPVLKKLGKIVPGTEFTHDQAIRVALWNASGYDIPGISESDIKTLVDFVNDNADLSEYTRKLQLISKRKEWSKPGDFWDAETILSDLNNLTEKVGRKEYLTEFIENVDIIFSEDNLNKVEAGYGEAQKEALKDIIYRMKNGTNRPSGKNKNENRFNNWVNNSIGAIMFFNRRSALLQTLSIANFINWGDNNVLKAGAAFANQPQYWKDFATLFNSSKLKQRRSGLKSDVNEAEIANAVKGSRNKAVSALSYLLKIGFTPTQLADSFAIASGGATFYRNRANSYLKEVNAEGEKVYTQKQAEEKAFEDFSQISEETQQSGDPALISSDQASTLGRLLLAFQNTPIQLNRSIKKAALDIKNRRRAPGQTMLQSDFSNISKIIYYGTVQNVIFSALQNALFALIPGFEDEDDELTEEEQLEKYGKIYSTKQSRIVNGMVDTTLKGGFGIPGAFISTIKNAYLEYAKQKEKGFIGDQGYTILAAANLSPPVGSKLRKIYSAIKTEEFDKDVIAKRGWDITIDGKFNLSPKYKVLGSVTEGLTNLPLDRMVAEVSSITEALDARNSKWQRIALALGWKTWDVNVKNEEHELIKIEAKQERKDAKAKAIQDYKDYRSKVFGELNNKENNAYNRTKGAKLKKEYILKIGKEKGIK
jgi:hypothetical protein